MAAYTLKAHFDGQSIKLDEPCNLVPNAPILVTIVTCDPDQEDAERADFIGLACASLERAYGDNEPEYTIDDIIK